MPALTVNAIKAQSVSDDGLFATFTFTTKYVGDLDVTMPAACLDELLSALKGARSDINRKDPKKANQLQLTVPKTFLVTADVKERGLVIVVFDHQAETRAGYALTPDAAKKLSSGLTQNADAVINKKAGNPSAPPPANQ